MSEKNEKSISEALRYHEEGRPGKLGIHATKSLITQRDLSLAYSPGVAEPCLEIKKDSKAAYKYTSKGNLVAVISNGTAVLGLGNLGAIASKPVMEGKAVLFKKFADVDSIDIEVDTQDIEEIIKTISNIACTFGGINLEDIKSPECFEIEERLSKELDIPVFHDDQHGTAIIVCAALINASELTARKLSELSVVVNGCGAAGISCIELMKSLGVKNIVVCDQNGVIRKDRQFAQDDRKQKYASDVQASTLQEALVGADVFIGLSVADVLKPDWLKQMNRDPMIFALANPDPEIKPELAKDARPDAIIATGRSDYGNQINNVMCFPYLFRGALDVSASKFNLEMKLAAVHAIANLAKKPIPDEVISAYAGMPLCYGKEYIIPKPFDHRLISEIAPAVAKAAMQTGVARKEITDFEVYKILLDERVGLKSNPFFTVIGNELKQKQKRVIFAEGEEEKSIRAAVQWRDMGYGIPVLVGRANVIEEEVKRLSISNLSGIEIANAAVSSKNDDYISHMYSLLQRKGFLYRRCVRDIKTNRNVFSSCMLALGDADAMVTGLTRTYDDCLNDILPIIGVSEFAFQMSIVITQKGTFFICDPAFNEMPDPYCIAEISVKAAHFVSSIGACAPKVAIIADSDFGSFNSKSADCAREAMSILDASEVSFEYDGEMDIDTAIGCTKDNYPFSKVAGLANVLIMPSAESANYLLKFLRAISDDVTIVGPFLLGLNHSVQVVSPSHSVSEIVNLALIAARMSDHLS